MESFYIRMHMIVIHAKEPLVTCTTKCYLHRLHVTRGSLLVITSLKMSLLNHHALLTCLTDQMAGCTLSEEIVKLKLPHVLKCVKMQSCELRIPKQPVTLVGHALGLFMCPIIALLLEMVSPQSWD